MSRSDNNLIRTVILTLNRLSGILQQPSETEEGLASPDQAPAPDTSLLVTNDIYYELARRSGYKRDKNSFLQGIQRRTVSRRFTATDRCYLGCRIVPNHINRKSTIAYQDKVFCGTFEKDGDLFISTSQDCSVRVYDASKVYGTLKWKKSVQATGVGWSILDTCVSPDGRFLVYSSWSDCLHLCPIDELVHQNTPLRLNPIENRFCVFSVKFSSDGKEILCGASDMCLYVYDLDAQTRTLQIPAHRDEINSVCYADSSSHILFTGGDDGLIKVWDRRVLNEANPKPVGVLAGHRNGITFIDSKGDGRYLISNSKDQSIKLWDIRRFASEEAILETEEAVRLQSWDYRWQPVPKHQRTAAMLPGDVSVMTYRGHTVLESLIRCRFSPSFTTGQRFIYTGCGTGAVRIYDILTGEMIHSLRDQNACVRDVSWHPYLPLLRSSSFDGTIKEWGYCSEMRPHEPRQVRVDDDEFLLVTRSRRRPRGLQLS